LYLTRLSTNCCWLVLMRGPNGVLDPRQKALAERVLNAEMDHHLAGDEPGNRRSSYDKTTVVTDTEQIELEVPRDH
jgi:putative transposase